jgi:guanine deaminase
MNEFMKAAIDEAFAGMSLNDGGPFGAVIVQDGKIIAKGHNEVLKTNDPTAHAEIVALRKASKLLGRFDLSDCEIYSSCEPCPMCFAAIHWAKMKKLYYGCTREDAAGIGFDDQYIYDVINNTVTVKQVEVITINREECLKPFEQWRNNKGKTMY